MIKSSENQGGGERGKEGGGERGDGERGGGREGGHERAQWKDHTAWILCHAMFTRPFSAALAFPTSYDYKDQGWRYVEPIYTSSVRDTKVQVLLVYRAEDMWDQNWCPQLAADLRMRQLSWILGVYLVLPSLPIQNTYILLTLSMSNISHKNYLYLVLSNLLICFSSLLHGILNS